MANIIKKIYELQDIGKGIITTLTEDNLLKIFDSTQGMQGLGNVLDVDNNIIGTKTINVNAESRLTIQPLDLDNDLSGLLQIVNGGSDTPTPNELLATIGVVKDNDFSGFEARESSLLIRDNFNNKGLENLGDYEANFTDRSLITKQFYEDNLPIIDGTETKVTAGSNVTITGNGSTATPYIINSTATASTTVINAGTNISVTGAGTGGSPYIINNTQVIDGSETKINAGVTTTVTGNGTTGSPYTVETVNLQKAITTSYALTSADNNYSIKVNNGATPITITIPTGLPENFFVGITQKGTADVTIVGSGATITNPIGLKIKGQGYHVGLEQIGTTNAFDLLGFTKA